MTKEDINWLKKFESNFNTAIKSNYSRNILESNLIKMKEIYECETGKKFSLCVHCTGNVLELLRLVGNLYFKAVQEGLEQELKINELENSVTEKENNTTNNTKNNTTKNTKDNAKQKHKRSKS